MKYLLLLCTVGHLVWTKPNSECSNPLVETINSKNTTWKAGVNFPGETPAEFAKKRLGLLGNHQDPNFHPEKKVHPVGRKTVIPPSFDARDQWLECRDVIDNIRDQGNCVSCWAFAAAEVMSDRLCILSKAELKFEFSPQDLLSCCPHCGYGCGGGYAFAAWIYWQERGIVSGGDYNTNTGCKPYEGLAYLNNTTPTCKTYCTNTNYTIAYDNDRRIGASYFSMSENIQQIQYEIMTNGPIQASYKVYEDFTTYKEGVYQYTYGAELGGHAVKIIGWGSENDVPYWLVANSWGSDWANLKGYFKIKRGSNECGIEANVIGGIPLYDSDPTTDPVTDSPDGTGSAMKAMSSALVLLLNGFIFFILYQ
ncbi:hypothetical protein Zmor_012431 [Zophobas morio]|uniref:Peptidase C1A papain C-terminal domain-containing protein n=1 Tax=Zophobas morio TaxID=2755281 RepID=A0AA38ME98_9CUCU|nr:hypothetical protein Zmor_012431 [Zophobas morio]